MEDKILDRKPKELTLIEIDKDLVNILIKKYENFKNIKIINDDILKFIINKNYETIISNLPYNISSQVLVKLSLINKSPSYLILMFQKEFALRLLTKKINSINSLIKCFYQIELNFHVSKNCFRPIPKVDSSVLSFIKRAKPLLKRKFY